MRSMAALDDPDEFAQEIRVLLKLLKVHYIGVVKRPYPFRYFSFRRGGGERKAHLLLSSMQALISRVSTYSLNSDCVELWVMRESWQSAHTEIDGYTGDGWAAWLASAPQMRAFDAQVFNAPVVRGEGLGVRDRNEP